MTAEELSIVRADIESTDDLLVRAMKLAALPDFAVGDRFEALRKELSK
jgi:hypothetical protein